MSPWSGSAAAPRASSSFTSASSPAEGPPVEGQMSTAAICALRPAARASRASRRQQARPMPLAAPVTSARTASGSRERLAFAGQPVQQVGGLPDVALGFPPLVHAIADGLEPDLVGPEHGAAKIG